MTQYKMKNPVKGKAKIGPAMFVDGEFETDDENIIALLDDVQRVKKVTKKPKKEDTIGGDE